MLRQVFTIAWRGSERRGRAKRMQRAGLRHLATILRTLRGILQTQGTREERCACGKGASFSRARVYTLAQVWSACMIPASAMKTQGTAPGEHSGTPSHRTREMNTDAAQTGMTTADIALFLTPESCKLLPRTSTAICASPDAQGDPFYSWVLALTVHPPAPLPCPFSSFQLNKKCFHLVLYYS